MSKAILIDVAAQDVREVEVDGLTDLQTLVGGSIEAACRWENGDVLYVDEEGLFKPQRAFFRLAQRGDYPFAGNGVVVGAEQYDEDGEYVRTDDTALSVAELRAAVTFVTRAQVDAWAKGNASEPAATVSYVENGRVVTDVVRRVGRLFGDMPRPDEPEIVAIFGTHPRYPGRFAIFHPDGALSNTFGLGQSRDEVATQLRLLGLVLRDDDTVIRQKV